MNSIERKLVDNTLEYNERLKNSNNELQLEIKALKNKIGNMQNAVDKLDSYRRQGANFIIWKNTPQEFPDTHTICVFANALMERLVTKQMLNLYTNYSYIRYFKIGGASLTE